MTKGLWKFFKNFSGEWGKKARKQPSEWARVRGAVKDDTRKEAEQADIPAWDASGVRTDPVIEKLLNDCWRSENGEAYHEEDI